MATQCTPAQLNFHPFGRRDVVAWFDAGRLSSQQEFHNQEKIGLAPPLPRPQDEAALNNNPNSVYSPVNLSL